MNSKQRRKLKRASTVVIVAVDNEARTITLEKLGPSNRDLRRRERASLRAMTDKAWATEAWCPGIWRGDAFFDKAFVPL